jgi:hypothetical protein
MKNRLEVANYFLQINEVKKNRSFIKSHISTTACQGLRCGRGDWNSRIKGIFPISTWHAHVITPMLNSGNLLQAVKETPLDHT